jgi:hypothetical protein
VPVETQPGKSGTYAEKFWPASSTTIAYSFIAASGPVRPAAQCYQPFPWPIHRPFFPALSRFRAWMDAETGGDWQPGASAAIHLPPALGRHPSPLQGQPIHRVCQPTVRTSGTRSSKPRSTCVHQFERHEQKGVILERVSMDSPAQRTWNVPEGAVGNWGGPTRPGPCGGVERPLVDHLLTGSRIAGVRDDLGQPRWCRSDPSSRRLRSASAWHTRRMLRRNPKVVLIVIVLLVWAIVTPFTWRDLRRRSPDQIRGSKWMWRVASSNLTGSIAYFLFGRKQAD